MALYNSNIGTFNSAESLASTAATSVPTSGNAIYTGNIAVVLSNATHDDLKLMANLKLDINFASADFNGAATNIAIIDSTGNVYSYGGQFSVINSAVYDGNANGKAISSDLDGAAAGTVAGGTLSTLTSNLDLKGVFRSAIGGDHHVVSGSVGGSIDRSVGVDLVTYTPSSGGFYACTIDCTTLP
ncbi:MAG: hypothetical protein V3V13_00770 [Paracoccaceae bacterium]